MTDNISNLRSLFSVFTERLFGAHVQPSVRRGALLLASLIFLNILVGLLVFLLGRSYPILSGLALLSWGFGLRHAMDADHIAAIDNVTRRLLYRGKHSVGVGVFFSLGHSSIVLLLTVAIVFFSAFTDSKFESLKAVGGIIGASVSSFFLVLIGTVNLFVLFKLIGALRKVNAGEANTYHGHMHIGGPIEKIFRPLLKHIDKSYKMYFIGFLFGLGFDTATEVGLLAIAAIAIQSIPPLAVLILPLAFMAGMTLLDTINGLFMLGIYSWGVFDEKRRLFYGINITLMSSVSALSIGAIVGLRLLSEQFHFDGVLFKWALSIRIESAGYWLAGFFLVSWIIALIGLRPKQETVS